MTGPTKATTRDSAFIECADSRSLFLAIGCLVGVASAGRPYANNPKRDGAVDGGWLHSCYFLFIRSYYEPNLGLGEEERTYSSCDKCHHPQQYFPANQP